MADNLPGVFSLLTAIAQSIGTQMLFTNIADPDQMPQNAASDHDLYRNTLDTSSGSRMDYFQFF